MKRIKRFYVGAYVLLILIFASSCGVGSKNREIEKSTVRLEIVRLDSVFNSFKKSGEEAVNQSVSNLLLQHNNFFEAFNTQVIKIGSAYNADYYKNLQSFLNYTYYNEVASEIENVFSDISFIEQKLDGAFGRYKTLYPNKKIPTIYMYNGIFNQSIVLVENGIGVGLDKYLGSDCHFYKQMGMQRFLIKKMYPEKIPSDVMIGFLQGEFPYDFDDEALLAKMIYSGRIMYVTELLLPEVADSVLWGYSEDDFSFLQASEDDIWLYLVDNKMLFNTDYMVEKKLLGDGPFTAFFSKQSPSRIGIWIGYRIVQKYMTQKKDVSIQELMEEKDYQKMLNVSKYNP